MDVSSTSGQPTVCLVPGTARTIDVDREGITIRVATSDDIAGVQHVASVTWRTTYSGAIPERDIDQFLTWVYSTDNLRQQIARFGDGFLVADISGRIVGYAMSGVNSDREPELYALYVLPEQQGNGTGWMLWTATLACLARSGCTRMFCWVLASNVRARRFYERQGAIMTEQRSFPIGATMVKEARYRVWIDPSSGRPGSEHSGRSSCGTDSDKPENPLPCSVEIEPVD